jgi:hypothetical protein
VGKTQGPPTIRLRFKIPAVSHRPFTVITASSPETSLPPTPARLRHSRCSPMGAIIASTSSWRASRTA